MFTLYYEVAKAAQELTSESIKNDIKQKTNRNTVLPDD
jgi:hypothetical protein